MNYWQPAIVALRAIYLPAYKAADIYVPIRHTSTFVEDPLQINLAVCKTKPIYQIPKMNVSIVKTRDYKNDYDFRPGKTNPNKPNSKPISEMLKMNVGSVKTKDYENDNDFALRKTNPKQTQSNPISAPHDSSPLSLRRFVLTISGWLVKSSVSDYYYSGGKNESES